MDRNHARRRRALRPFADAPDMAGIAQRDRGEPRRLRFRDANVDGLGRDDLAEAVAAVEHGDDRRIDQARDRLIGHGVARAHPVDIARHAQHAVAVVPGEIGVDQRGGDGARLFGPAADALENFGAEVGQRAGRNMYCHLEIQKASRQNLCDYYRHCEHSEAIHGPPQARRFVRASSANTHRRGNSGLRDQTCHRVEGLSRGGTGLLRCARNDGSYIRTAHFRKSPFASFV